MATLLQRQNSIFRAVEEEIKKREYSYKLPASHANQLHNPAVQKLLEEHERIVSNNKRFVDRIFRKRALDSQEMERKRALTKQHRRGDEQPLRGNRSSASSRSNQSARSHRTVGPDSRSSTHSKERLLMVRQK
jgi:nicotinamide mononucleotide adenylyltransferase